MTPAITLHLGDITRDGEADAIVNACPAADVDNFSLHVTVANSSLTAQVDSTPDPASQCDNGTMALTVSVYSPSGALLATNASKAAGDTCGKVSLTNLPVGNYYVRVQATDGNTSYPAGPAGYAYTVQTATTPP